MKKKKQEIYCHVRVSPLLAKKLNKAKKETRIPKTVMLEECWDTAAKRLGFE